MVHDEDSRSAALESLWYEVIDAVQAGRTAGLRCPECQADADLQIEEQQGRVVVTCPSCQRVVEVSIATA